MKLLVLAQTPPPVHGQSVMVQALVNGLPPRGLAVHHLNLRLSRDAADIGRWRAVKIVATLGFALRAVAARCRHGCDTLYYVPAPPAKRGALYRDWLVMAICRPFFRRVVLHWHAVGLGEWLRTDATVLERSISRVLLGRAHLAIVLGAGLRADAALLRPRRIAIVANGIPDPGQPSPASTGTPFHAVFLGTCSEEKGLFTAARAVIAANRLVAARPDAPAFVLTAAGPFDAPSTESAWQQLAARHAGMLQHVGVVDEPAKRALFARAHALCFPTRYSAEALPLVAIEALAHDRPIVATRWRGLPDIVTDDVGMLVPPGDESALAAALTQLARRTPAAGVCRARFDRQFTLERHLNLVVDALAQLQ